MTYRALLTAMVAKSGMTLREIADKCRELGQEIAPSYISKLQTGAQAPPSEEVSRAIANAVGGNVEDLVWQGYIEKSPGPVQAVLAWYRRHWDSFLLATAALLVEGKYLTSDEEFVKRRTEIYNEIRSSPQEKQLTLVASKITNSLISLQNRLQIDASGSMASLADVDMHSLGKASTYELVPKKKAPTSNRSYILVPDDGMAPIHIHQGSEVACKDLDPDDPDDVVIPGKIYAVWLNDKVLIRRIFAGENQPTVLQADNPSYPPITISPEDDFEVWGIVEGVEFNPNEDPTSPTAR